MKTDQALSLLEQATQPGVRLSRSSYVQIEKALIVLAKELGLSGDPDEANEAEAEEESENL